MGVVLAFTLPAAALASLLLRGSFLDRWQTVFTAAAVLALIIWPLVIFRLRRLLDALRRAYDSGLSAAERRATELRVTLRSIGDAVIATNASGGIVFLNPIAEALTGWANELAQGRPLEEVFAIFDGKTGAPATNPVARVLKEKAVVELSEHTILKSRDGREIPIDDSAAPILGEDGEVQGVILVFHDVTVAREAERALRDSETRFRFLNEVGESTRGLAEPRDIMVRVTSLLGSHLRVSRCAYADVQPDTEHFTIQHDYTDGCESTAGNYNLSLFGPRAASAMRRGKTLVLQNVEAELAPGEGSEMFEALAIRAIVCCPLMKGGALRAMMAVHQAEPRKWTAAEISLVEEIVERCWAIIERARAESEVMERARLAALRADVASQLASHEPLDSILQGCCGLLVHHLDAAFARVWIMQAGGTELGLRASAGLYTHLDGPHSRIRAGEFKIGRIAHSRRPHLTNDVPSDPNISDAAWAAREGMRAFAGYPLILEGRVLGVVALFSSRSLSEAVLTDLAPIADGIAQCIERKNADTALQASENLKSAIINTSLDGFILMDHQGLVVDWNAAAERIFGRPRAEVLGASLADTIVPERLREAHKTGVARYVATREARILNRRYELPALRADGEEFPCEISINHIPGTEPPLFAGFVRDITARQRSEDELRAAMSKAEAGARAVADSTERLRLLAEVVSLQVWTAQPSGELDYVNQECIDYHGVADASELLGTAWAQFVHPNDRLNTEQRWLYSLGTGERYEVEFRLCRPTGEYRWFLARAEAMRENEAGLVKWFGTNTDIHDLKVAQGNAEAASRAKDHFLAALSHELRTPLTPVLMTATALRHDERLPSDVREQLSMIERNIALEARLIDDLLDLTLISKGKLRLRPQNCDAHSLIGLAVEIVRDDAQAKAISIQLDLAAHLTGIDADPARFQQVIWNMLRNAVKFTPRGGSVWIRTRDAAAAGQPGCLHIEVTDSGIGIAEDQLAKIFLPFEQAGLTGDHRFGGMGLGLAIVRAIVDLHGGTVRAVSGGLNQGATFILEFPGAGEAPSGVTATSDAASHGQASERDKSESRTATLRLLLVEDHEPTLQILTRLLTRAGHQVVSASTSAAALAAAAAGTFDLVVSDIGLPDGTGIELMQQLREAYGLTGIALSGYGMDEDLVRSREAGFALHLTKPVDFSQLERALRELVATSI